MARFQTLEWMGDERGHLRLIDQTKLPTEITYRDCRSAQDVWEAIRSLQVRGAPAIGIAAAYGIALGCHSISPLTRDSVHKTAEYLRTSRPTAVNLFWALDRMERTASDLADDDDLLPVLLKEARAIHEEDRAICRAIGEVGASLIKDNSGILTHCNAGALAAADYGTALAVFFVASEQGRKFSVFADETRPLLQGSRLTAWELQQAGIDTTLICDNMAAQVMKEGRIHMALTGADRIAANGDTANKIGTYGVAVLAKAHGIPFYVAAPSSTFDLSLPTGESIPIEQRDPIEITTGFGKQTAPDGIQVYNPAFDVTPAHLISGIITERGLIQPVNADQICTMIE